MNIIGLDLSLTDSGVFYSYNNTNYQLNIKSKEKGVTRLIDIKTQLWQELFTKINFDLIVIEGYGFSTFKGHSLGELGGVIKVLLKTKFPKTPIILVPPTVLKKFITGKGNADKSQMLLQIYKKYDKEFNNHNIADAYALFEFGKMCLKDKKTKEEVYLVSKTAISK